MSVFENAWWSTLLLGFCFVFVCINCYLLNWNTQLFGIDTKMGIFCMKRCSVSIMVVEMQVNITMRYHLTPVIISVRKKTRNTYWWRCGKTGPLVHWWWDWILLQPLWKRAWRILIKLKTVLSYNQQFHHCVFIQRDWNHHHLKKISVPHVYCCIIYNIQDLETTYMSIDRWLDDNRVIYMEYYSVLFNHKNRRKISHLQQCDWILRAVC